MMNFELVLVSLGYPTRSSCIQRDTEHRRVIRDQFFGAVQKYELDLNYQGITCKFLEK